MTAFCQHVSYLFLLLMVYAPAGFAASGATLDAKPKANTSELERGLARYPGQNQFITAERVRGGLRAAQGLESAPSLEAANAPKGGGSAQREVMDSDVFKVGPKGSKDLILLNGYRGLMVLDFKNGADRPLIVGRAPATGNHPTNMYVDWKSKKAVVIENWDRQNYGSGARILVYDLSNLAKPKVIQTLYVKGTVWDSRMVGDVLYLVGMELQANYYGGDEQRKSYLKSYKLSDEKIAEVGSHYLANSVDYRENMGIQEIAHADGTYGYYVTAITKQRGRQNWWGLTRSEVEVVDISSVEGKINPLMIASVTGDIAKRSWVNVRDHALVVASNYRPQDNWQSPARVAVEVFKLPHEGMTVISEREALYRELAIERALPSGNQEKSGEVAEDLLANSQHKLRGVFVTKGKDAKILTKTMADFKPLDFGDTTGLSANVQDVRLVVSADNQARLQVAWVPANMMDPLDIIDVSNVNARPVYQSRLVFDGWLERTIPLEFNGRNFILGLGYVIPAVDNPQNRRTALAKLIEVKKSANGQWTSQDLASLTLSKVQWSDVGGQDKLVSLNFDAKSGKGSVLFKGHNWSTQSSFSTGGQAVEFDLAANDNAAFLREGAFIQGEEGWLRRVFMHRDLDAMMTFSDRELGVFKAGETTSGEKVVDVASRMELARNIVAYYEFLSIQRGVQVITSSPYGRSSKEKSELRIVPMGQADRPVGEMHIQVPGTLKDVWVDTAKNEMVILTSDTEWSGDNEKRTRTYTLNARRVHLKVGQVDISEPWSYTETRSVDEINRRYEAKMGEGGNFDDRLSSSIQGLVKVDGGWAFVDDDNQIWKLATSGNGLVAKKIKLKVEQLLPKAEYELALIDGVVVLNVRQHLEGQVTSRGWKYSLSWVARVNTSKDDEWTLEAKQTFNIPGVAKGFLFDRSGKIAGILSAENRLLDLMSGASEPALNLISVGRAGAILSDAMRLGSEDQELTRTSANQWVFVENDEQAQSGRYGWGGYGSSAYGRNSFNYRLAFIDVDTRGLTLHRTVRGLDGQLEGYGASVQHVAEGKNANERQLVIAAESDVQVLNVDIKRHTAQVVAIVPVNTHVDPAQKTEEPQRAPELPSTVWNLPGYVGGSSRGAISLSDGRIRIALGDYGVCEGILNETKILPIRRKK